jgi:hypothetical protein
VIDEEEYNLIKQMKDAKKLYRESFDKLRTTKADVLVIQNNID